MDFDLSEEQQMLAKTVRDWARKESTVERFRKVRDADGLGFDPKGWAQMGELGWLAMPFPESVGGFGGSFVDAGLALEELGKMLVPEPYLASVALAGRALEFQDLRGTVIEGINELIAEKESRVRESLRMLGMGNAALFGAWYITYAIIFAALCIVFTIAASFRVFYFASPTLLFLFFWLWCMSFVSFAASFAAAFSSFLRSASICVS